MNSPVLPRRFRLFRVLATAAAAYAGLAAPVAQAAVSLATGGTLAVGIEYVTPAFVGGAKVRTPEGVDGVLADDLAHRLSAVAQAMPFSVANPVQSLDDGKARVLLVPVADSDPVVGASALLIPTGYAAGAMAIMRSDTNIKRWEQLEGRTVCLAEGGRYVGELAAKYGAIEKVFVAPADSLLALRIGGCDAAVHDSTMLTELIKLPEWKKFSARLPVQDLRPLAFAVSARDAESADYLKQVANDWARTGYLEKITKAAVQDIAFEVYLDQTVTDCH